MHDEQYIMDTLEIADWPEDKRSAAVIEATMRIGTSLLEGLTDQQMNEYQAIVDDTEDVINAWLDQNVPDYKENAAYKEIAAGYTEDPERNNPAKIFASIAWVQLNVPDFQQRIDSTLTAYKQELATT